MGTFDDANINVDELDDEDDVEREVPAQYQMQALSPPKPHGQFLEELPGGTGALNVQMTDQEQQHQ